MKRIMYNGKAMWWYGTEEGLNIIGLKPNATISVTDSEITFVKDTCNDCAYNPESRSNSYFKCYTSKCPFYKS